MGHDIQPDPYDHLWRAVMQRWASLDGHAAMAHARTYGSDGDYILGDMLVCWMARDLAGCTAEIQSFNMGDEYVDAFATLARASLSRALDVVAKQLSRAAKRTMNGPGKPPPSFWRSRCAILRARPSSPAGSSSSRMLLPPAAYSQ